MTTAHSVQVLLVVLMIVRLVVMIVLLVASMIALRVRVLLVVLMIVRLVVMIVQHVAMTIVHLVVMTVQRVAMTIVHLAHLIVRLVHMTEHSARVLLRDAQVLLATQLIAQSVQTSHVTAQLVAVQLQVAVRLSQQRASAVLLQVGQKAATQTRLRCACL